MTHDTHISRSVGRVIIWKAPKRWRRIVAALLPDIMSPQIIDALAKTDRSELCRDDPGWVDLLADAAGFEDADALVDALSARLAKIRLRTYHACRPIDVGSYFKYGLRVMNPAEQLEILRNTIMQDGRYKDRVGDIDKCAEAIDTETRVGHSYLGLDDRFLVKCCGHYLIYGSEYRLAVMTNLLGEAGRQLLATYGTPTILHVDFPIADLSHTVRWDLARLLLRDWIRIQAVGGERTFPEDFGFSVRQDIPAAMIVGYTQPEVVPNPLEWGAVWRAEDNRIVRRRVW